MGQKHTERDVAAAGIRFSGRVSHEFGDGADYGSVEFEEAAFVEDHRHGCCSDSFRNGGQIKEICGRHSRIKIPTLSQRAREGWGTLSSTVIPRIYFVGEMAQALAGDQTIAVRDRDGRSGEGVLVDRFAQYGEGGCEGFVLPVES